MSESRNFLTRVSLVTLATFIHFIRGILGDYTIVTQCGCFNNGRNENSIIPVSLKDCDASFSFVCCAAIKISSTEKVKHLCCLDKKDVQAPAFLDKCVLTSLQYDNIESIFGKSSVLYHRQYYTLNSTFVSPDDQIVHLYRSNMLFGAMTLVAFLCLVSLCFCSKFCQRNLIRRINQVNEGARNEIMECYLLQNLNSQSILRDFNPYSPYAFAPPRYETLPKEPPRYSRIYLLESEPTNETGGSAGQPANQTQLGPGGGQRTQERDAMVSMVVTNIQPPESKDVVAISNTPGAGGPITNQIKNGETKV